MLKLSDDGKTLENVLDRYANEVIIPNGVTRIGYHAFSNCHRLKNVIIPNSVTDICDWAFDGCSSLQSIDIPNSVKSIGKYAFADCISLGEIAIPSRLTKICGELFTILSGWKINLTDLYTLTIFCTNTKERQKRDM